METFSNSSYTPLLPSGSLAKKADLGGGGLEEWMGMGLLPLNSLINAVSFTPILTVHVWPVRNWTGERGL